MENHIPICFWLDSPTSLVRPWSFHQNRLPPPGQSASCHCNVGNFGDNCVLRTKVIGLTRDILSMRRERSYGLTLLHISNSPVVLIPHMPDHFAVITHKWRSSSGLTVVACREFVLIGELLVFIVLFPVSVVMMKCARLREGLARRDSLS
ncbi:hypothetical protein M9H77_35540 [Catharanthus roseus]|uniref:Uncharacterized protein n=1 Tax=Catharanthus roseus TaxID=4058 RepID=A0ACB9ZPK7_CATRO|nr:hypothetical protein M9H77_35540 [Catharanthus roseus]